ncbi:hypothetical protein [Paractinoplanes lichenicola]|uniref:ESX-1 secretion-associated protein n=1 Tax=Paractinoplanes lichenicola TaxID=2802976 RepID=A0ABS1VME5_9ACTN|nr:hypothetical protein [Actinoplanes lichenicola]MBL7254922.1 hypothetical protein [Actinoplanes lichenicola]
MSDGIRVETDGLNKFSDQVQDDTSRTLEPGYSDARVSFGTGVRFGTNNASGSVHAAKARYAASVEASTANIEEYMAAARVLADAAAKVAEALDATDMRAADRTDWINGALVTAATEAQARRQAAERAIPHGGRQAI